MTPDAPSGHPAATIAAIATPSGTGALGVIRISGPESETILAALTPGATLPHPRRAALRTLRDTSGEPLDEALVLHFPAPRSFTGEAVVELHCHGGRITLQRVLDAVLAAGARPADPGAFSRRALHNGRLDLLQVEAIAEMIHASSEAAQRQAVAHLQGRLSAALAPLRESLVALMVSVEAAIDFSLEEHVYSITGAEIAARCAPIAAGLRALLGTWDAGRLLREGVGVAIVGRPNAGKSSLLNHLLGEERALVTAVAGTTRDWIEETLRTGGLAFRLVDTAGLRATEDQVEALGIARARERAAAADVLLAVAEAGDTEAAAELATLAGDRPWALLWNKADLRPAPQGQGWCPAACAPPLRTIELSLRTGAGCEALPPTLLALAAAAGLDGAEEGEVLLTRARHREAVAAALAALERGSDAAEAGLEHELIAMDLREALDHVASLTGAVTTDELLARIFDGFCIGK